MLLTLSCEDNNSDNVDISYKGTGSWTRGLANSATVLFTCMNGRTTATGPIVSPNGSSWTVPAETQFASATKASDLYNECTGIKPGNVTSAELGMVPIKQIDAGGDDIIGYIFADNYFELYINGILVAVDPVPYTPFNSSVVRFRVKRPYTIAFKVVDWEENLGLGTESSNNSAFHPGDGGIIASFSDGTVTNGTWKAQTYYVAPIDNLNNVVELPDGTISSVAASTTPACNNNCFALHWPVPQDWTSKTYDDSKWPVASVYTKEEVGVDNKPAFTNFSNVWTSADFVWTSNLILDNVVLMRKTVK